MSFNLGYDFDFGELVDGLTRALLDAAAGGESDWVIVEADVFEFDEDVSWEDLLRARAEDIPATLSEALEELGLSCELHRFTGEPGLRPEYVAVCHHVLSGEWYTVYFDVDFDHEAGLARVVAVKAVRGAYEPGADYR